MENQILTALRANGVVAILLHEGPKPEDLGRDPIGVISTNAGKRIAPAPSLIHGLLSGANLRETVEFETASARLKRTFQGDLDLILFDEPLSPDEIAGLHRDETSRHDHSPESGEFVSPPLSLKQTRL